VTDASSTERPSGQIACEILQIAAIGIERIVGGTALRRHHVEKIFQVPRGAAGGATGCRR